jgi:putative SOS response-associated peptidase YedK
MCNLYSFAKGQQAIRELAGAMRDRTGNLPLIPGIYPDYRAPVVRNQPEGRELTMARCGACRRRSPHWKAATLIRV